MAEEKIGSELFNAITKEELARLLIEISQENDRLRAQEQEFRDGLRDLGGLGENVETLMSAAAVGLKAAKQLNERIDVIEGKLDDLTAAAARLIDEFRILEAAVHDAGKKASEKEREGAENAAMTGFDINKVIAELDARAADREKNGGRELTDEDLDRELARRRAEVHALREAERRRKAVRNGSWSGIFND